MTQEVKDKLIESTKNIKAKISVEDNYKLLIEKCIITEDINSKDNNGDTLLAYAIFMMDRDLVQFLLENGINPNSQNIHENNSTMICIAKIADILNCHINNDIYIYQLLEILKLLIQYGANPNLQNMLNQNSYYIASETGFLERKITKILNNEDTQKLKKIK